jgi:hypothetical protein
MLDTLIILFAALMTFWASVLMGKEAGVLIRHVLLLRSLRKIHLNLVSFMVMAKLAGDYSVLGKVKEKDMAVSNMLAQSGDILHFSLNKVSWYVAATLTILFLLWRIM